MAESRKEAQSQHARESSGFKATKRHHHHAKIRHNNVHLKQTISQTNEPHGDNGSQILLDDTQADVDVALYLSSLFQPKKMVQVPSTQPSLIFVSDDQVPITTGNTLAAPSPPPPLVPKSQSPPPPSVPRSQSPPPPSVRTNQCHMH